MISRRSFLEGSAAAAVAGLTTLPQALRAAPRADTALGKVKIRDVKTAVVNIKYNTCLVKVTTDSGLYGLGEAFPKADVAADIHTVKTEIINEDPLRVEYLHQKMTEQFISRGSRTGALCGAIAGIEIALWDLAGKILNVPVHVLLGGAYRNKVLVYHDTPSPKHDDPKAWAEEALKSRDHGFKAMKFSLPRFEGDKWSRAISPQDMRRWTRILEETRKALGPDFPLGVDLHWKYNATDTLTFTRMIEHINLWFLEDPIAPENVEAFARLTAESKVPIATGENLYSRQGFRPFLEKQACDIIQPDAQKCGGLLETKKIADWADLYSISMLCHNGCTPLGTIASGHACMAIKSFLALESDSVEVPHWQDIVRRDGPIYRDGYLEVPTGPGLGVELNEEVCRRHLAEGSGFFD